MTHHWCVFFFCSKLQKKIITVGSETLIIIILITAVTPRSARASANEKLLHTDLKEPLILNESLLFLNEL